jgi:hypothetical protein
MSVPTKTDGQTVNGAEWSAMATDVNSSYKAGGTDVALADGGTGASLVDPNADRIMFWDDSAGATTWLTPGSNLTITGTTIDATAGGSGDMVLASAQTVTGAKTFNAGTLLDKGSRVFDVKAYGATGNGTTDDTTNIQSAITAAGAVKGTVFFPPGTYKITSALSLGASGVTIQGAGFQSTVITQATAGTHGFTASNLREFCFRDFKLVGQGTGTADAIYLAVTGTTAGFDCEFTNLFITTWGRYGVHAETLCASSFRHVRIEHCGSDGFHLSDNGTSGLPGTSLSFNSCYANTCAGAGYWLENLIYCSLNGCATDSCNYGYYLKKCGGVTLQGCGCESTSGAQGHGFVIADTSVGNVLSGCYALSLASTAIGFWVTAGGGSNSSRNTIVNCRVSGASAPTNSAKVDSSNQAVFIGFNPHSSGPNSFLGTVTEICSNNTQTTTGLALDLASNTLTGTTAQFNTALSDNDFATLAGTETLTAKTLTNPKVNALKDTNGNNALVLSSVGSAVNYVQTSNAATGSYPGLQAAGSDTNVGFDLIPQANAPVRIYTATGVTPKLQAAGADSNLNLNLVPKGTGIVQANGVPVMNQVSVPGTVSATGVVGQMAFDSSNLYICTASNTWRRVAISTF